MAACQDARQGTHSLVGVGPFTAASWLACLFRHTWPARIVLALILVAGIAGTMLTVEGCPLAWPLSPQHFGLPRPLSWSARPETGPDRDGCSPFVP